MAFSVRYGDTIVEVHTKGVNPEWVYHQLKNLITEWLIQSAASDWELRFSFGDFDFLRYNEKKVVRLEHHFLSYRVKEASVDKGTRACLWSFSRRINGGWQGRRGRWADAHQRG